MVSSRLRNQTALRVSNCEPWTARTTDDTNLTRRDTGMYHDLA